MRLKNVIKPGKRRIAAFASKGGNCEFFDFMAELRQNRKSDWAGLYDLLKRASNREIPPTSAQIDKLSEGIYEFIKGDARVLWFEDDEGNILICSHGLVKKSQKTPKAEIDKASQRRDEYFAAKKARALRCDWEDKK